MLIAAFLLLTAGPSTTVPAASAALRSNARAAPPASAFSTGLAVVDEQGAVVGKVVSVARGLVTVKTPRVLLTLPASAFVMQGGLMLKGIPAAQLEALARTGLPTK